jgi:Rieske Fe-S protein
LHELLEQAQASINAVAAATLATATQPDQATSPVAVDAQLVETADPLSDTLLPPSPDETDTPQTAAAAMPTAKSPEKYTPEWAIDEVKHAVEGHEVLAAGAAGAVGGLALAGVFALLGR